MQSFNYNMPKSFNFDWRGFEDDIHDVVMRGSLNRDDPRQQWVAMVAIQSHPLNKPLQKRAFDRMMREVWTIEEGELPGRPATAADLEKMNKFG